MTTPDPATTPPAKKTSAVVRVGRIFLTIIAVLILASAIFGKKDKDSAAPDSAAAKPASAPASKPTNDASPTASKPLIMEKAKAFVGGGEWEEFVEGGFKLLVPGRSRDFKAARVSGIHEVTVRNVRSTRGSEGERFATSIVVYLDDSFRDANGRYREYVLIANWIALVESWVKSVPVSDQSKAAAVRYMEDKLSAAFAAPVGDYGTLALPSGVSFNFMTGGKASVGQPVKWLHIETYLRLSDGSTGADEAATKPAIAPALTPAHYP